MAKEAVNGVDKSNNILRSLSYYLMNIQGLIPDVKGS